MMVYVASVVSQGTVLPTAARPRIKMHELDSPETLMPGRLYSIVVMLIM
jgi:hypothetical protein